MAETLSIIIGIVGFIAATAFVISQYVSKKRKLMAMGEKDKKEDGQ